MHASSNKSDSTVIGKKRSLTDIDSGAKVPSKANFDFTPTPLPHQNIFSIDTHPSTWSASSLNYRYQQQLKAKRQPNKQRSSSPQSEQATLYASKQWPTRPASQPTSISTVSSPIPAWTNYIYHRSLSSTIIGYIQLICNVVILSTIGYILFQLIFTLQQDFQIKADEYTNVLIQEIQSCAHQYKINMCHPETRVPALEKKCEHWLACSNRLPSQVTKAKVSAETIAEIFNSFFDALSYKTMASPPIFSTVLI